MSKFVFLILSIFTSIAMAMPDNLEICNPKLKVRTKLAFNQGSVEMEIWAAHNDGTPAYAKNTYAVTSSQQFTKADFSTEDVVAIEKILDIKDFTGGTHYLVLPSASSVTILSFYEFAPDSYAVMWIINGAPLPLGKTTNCETH